VSLRAVGRAITQAEADRWSSRAENTLSRQYSSVLSVGKDNLRLLVEAIEDYDGFFFYHGLKSNQHHIFVIPYRKGKNFWEDNVTVDANVDQLGEAAIAKIWTDAFQWNNPSGPWSHFFGRNLIQNIMAQDGFEKIEILPAINDSGEHLLLLHS
jgi:hypothetical protein